MVRQCVRVVCLMLIAGIFQFCGTSALCSPKAGGTSSLKTNDKNSLKTKGIDLLKNEKAKVYALFFSFPEDLVSKVVGVLEKKCQGVEFVTKTVSYDGTKYSQKTDPDEIYIDDEQNNSIIQMIEKEKKDLDGLILFFGGISDRRYMMTGLPTIAVDYNPCMREVGFKNAAILAERYGTKFITPAYDPNEVSDDQPDDIVEIEERIGNLPKKVRLLKVIRKLKNAKILTVQDPNEINIFEGHTLNKSKDYGLKYAGRLKEYLGVDIKISRSKELLREIGKVEDKEAEKIADMWIKEAKEVRRGVKRKDVIRAAGLYIALNELFKKYDADAITMASWKLLGAQKTNVMPPLSWIEFSKKHIPCSCETLIDCLVGQMVGAYITQGYAGFVGDVLNDRLARPTGARPENVVIIGHSGAPITPHGNDRIAYTIRDHVVHGASWAKAFPPGGPATATATTVEWPTDEVVTLIRFDVYRRRISVFTGTILDGNSLYKRFPDSSCRDKMVIRIDNPEDCYMLPSDPKEGTFRWRFRSPGWGRHQTVFYGNLRQEIKDFATLTGFEVVEVVESKEQKTAASDNSP